MVTGQQIEKARREYAAALGTIDERSKRKRMEWLVRTAQLEHEERTR
jgi:hypothetical protein